MNTSFYIAKRYFLSKKKKNFINIISIISVLAVAFGTMALVVVLSVFNGLEDFLRSMYSAFDPDLKVEATIGKSFPVTSSMIESIEQIEGVAQVTGVVEDNAYARYKDSEMIVKVKGVEPDFIRQGRFKESLVYGEPELMHDGKPRAILGQGVRYNLSVDPGNDMNTIQLFYPKKGRVVSYDPNSLVNRRNILPGAVFSIEKQFNINYIFVPLQFAIDLTGYGEKRTALEIMVKNKFAVEAVQDKLKSLLGEGFQVLDSDEQHSSLLRVLKIEKLFVFLIFSFIIAVSSFNIFFSLTMLAIDKKKDISILYSMGATDKLIKNIFLAEGAIISFSGAGVGLVLGFLIVMAQKVFGLVSMGMTTSVVDAYPVKMVWTDFMYTALVLVVITLLASLRPATIATRYNSWLNL